MTVDPHTAKHRADHRGHALLFLLRRLPHKIRRPTRRSICSRARAARTCGRRARSTPARCIPRSGRSAPAPARSAAWRSSRRSPPPRRAQSRTRRHDAALLDRPCSVRCRCSRWRWAAISPICTCWSASTLSNWIQFALATPVVLWAGWPFFVRGWQSLVTRNLNMFTLIAMGTGVAWIYSVVGDLAPGTFPAGVPRS